MENLKKYMRWFWSFVSLFVHKVIPDVFLACLFPFLTSIFTNQLHPHRNLGVSQM